MIIHDNEVLEKTIYDCIIIGSGPASIPVALELEKKKKKCLIVEAGSKKNDKGNTKFLNSVVEGDQYNDLRISRLRQFGGTSGHWGGTCNLFNKHELNNWPINYDEIYKFKDLACNFLDIKDQFYTRAFNDDFYQSNLVVSKLRIYDKFFEYIAKSQYINLSLKNIFISFNFKQRYVDTINCYKNKIIKLNAKYFVLACGGIENSRLLLLNQKNSVLENLPIGKFYTDHPWHKVAEGIINYQMIKNYYKKNKFDNKDILNCIPYPNLYFSTNANFTKKNNILNAGIYLGIKKENNRNFIEKLSCIAPKYVKQNLQNFNFQENYFVEVFLNHEQETDNVNRIELSSKIDPMGMPFAKLFWYKSELIRLSAKRITTSFVNFFTRKGFGRFALESFLFNSDENYYSQVGYHQMGGTIMGNSKRDSVVDSNLKVHGLENLYLSGSSVFNSSGHIHPTFTIVCLAFRLGRHIRSIQ